MNIPDLKETVEAYLPVLKAHLEEVRFCPACGFGKWEHVACEDRYGLPVPSAICTRCGLVYLQERPDGEGVKLLYGDREGHDRSWYRELVAAWWQKEFPPKHYERLAENYGDALALYLDAHIKNDRPLRLLDVGGGAGRIAHRIAHRPWGTASLVVLEPCLSEARIAQGLGCRTIHATAEDWEPNGETWDLILMCQTIDHLRKPASVLRKLRECLAPNGRLFADAVAYRIRRDQIGEVNALQVDHPVNFDCMTFLFTLRNCGFEKLDGSWRKEFEHGGIFRPMPMPMPRYWTLGCDPEKETARV